MNLITEAIKAVGLVFLETWVDALSPDEDVAEDGEAIDRLRVYFELSEKLGDEAVVNAVMEVDKLTHHRAKTAEASIRSVGEWFQIGPEVEPSKRYGFLTKKAVEHKAFREHRDEFYRIINQMHVPVLGTAKDAADLAIKKWHDAITSFKELRDAQKLLAVQVAGSEEKANKAKESVADLGEKLAKALGDARMELAEAKEKIAQYVFDFNQLWQHLEGHKKMIMKSDEIAGEVISQLTTLRHNLHNARLDQKTAQGDLAHVKKSRDCYRDHHEKIEKEKKQLQARWKATKLKIQRQRAHIAELKEKLIQVTGQRDDLEISHEAQYVDLKRVVKELQETKVRCDKLEHRETPWIGEIRRVSDALGCNTDVPVSADAMLAAVLNLQEQRDTVTKVFSDHREELSLIGAEVGFDSVAGTHGKRSILGRVRIMKRNLLTWSGTCSANPEGVL